MVRRWQLVKLSHVGIRYRTALGLLLLLVASYGGNLTRYTLFFDIDFLLGSIAVWVIACLYGVRWGTLAGFVSGVCTYVLWHHPYTIITFTCEALFVGWLFHRYRQNIVLLDGIFWVAIGMPLVWLFYAVILQVDPVQVQIILLKQPINGIFNALVASLLITHIPLHRWLGRPQAVSTLSFRQTVFNLLVAFVFLPTLLLIVLASRGVVETIRTTAQTEIGQVSSNVAMEIRSWYQQHLLFVRETVQLTQRGEFTQVDQIQQNLRMVQRMLPDFASLTMLAVDGDTVVASTDLNQTAANQIGAIAQPTNLPYLQFARLTLQPILSDVVVGENVAETSVVLTVPILQGLTLRGFVVAEIRLDTVHHLLQINGNEPTVKVTLVGRQNKVIGSTDRTLISGQPLDRRQDGDLHWLGEHTYQWFPNRGSRLMMVRWMNSFFVQETAIAPDLPWHLIVETSAQADALQIQRIYTRNLAIILAISALALFSSAWISRQLVRSLAQLAKTTTNLPAKLLTGEPIEWADSRVTEVAFLVRNFRSMAATLTQKFQEIQQALDYDARLKRITDKVRDSLDEAQILQSAVQELGQGLNVVCCDAAIYNAEQTISTISYEYTTTLPSARGQEIAISNQSLGVHRMLLRGEYCQFCLTMAHPFRRVNHHQAILACPIMDDQAALGDLWLFKPNTEVFTNSEIRLVQQVANQCAIAIRQARLYQTAQIQVRALEELNQLKDDFLSTVSHELRTPITNIKIAIKMLRLAKAEEQRDRYLNILQTECDRESNLINDLLDLQRLASGTKVLNLEPIDLQAWVAHVIESFQERTRTRQQVLQVEIAGELPVIQSDPTCLERILAELLNNACKYTPPGEQIKVSARTIIPTIQAVEPATLTDLSMLPYAKSAVFVLDVCNSGVEIPPHELEHIFDKFYRVPGIDRWKQGGTGLGLALVQKMIEHLGGRIRVESASNQTRFTVELPFDNSLN